MLAFFSEPGDLSRVGALRSGKVSFPTNPARQSSSPIAHRPSPIADRDRHCRLRGRSQCPVTQKLKDRAGHGQGGRCSNQPHSDFHHMRTARFDAVPVVDHLHFPLNIARLIESFAICRRRNVRSFPSFVTETGGRLPCSRSYSVPFALSTKPFRQRRGGKYPFDSELIQAREIIRSFGLWACYFSSRYGNRRSECVMRSMSSTRMDVAEHWS